MGAAFGGSVSKRPRQKTGAWTRKKLRRLRLQREAERGIVRTPQRRRSDPPELFVHPNHR